MLTEIFNTPASIVALVIALVIVVIDLVKIFDAPMQIANEEDNFNIEDEFDYRRCNGITRTGDLCKCWAKAGFSLCRWHLPGGAPIGKCTGILRNSRRCRFRAKYGDKCGHRKTKTVSRELVIAPLVPVLVPVSAPAPEQLSIAPLDANSLYSNRIPPIFIYSGIDSSVIRIIYIPINLLQYINPL